LPKRDSWPGPPQPRREEEQKEETSAKDEETLSWDEAQAQFGLGAGPMSQGSGSPVAFFDAETCDMLIQDLRGVDGKIPDFASVGSHPGSPSAALEAEVAHGERATQTSPVPTHDQATDPQAATVTMSDQATQVVSRPHQATSETQTPCPAPTSDQATQVLLHLHANGDGDQKYKDLLDASPPHAAPRHGHRHAPGSSVINGLPDRGVF